MDTRENTINKNSYKDDLLEALKNLKISLSIKKLLGPKIKLSEFKDLLETTKNLYEVKIKLAIDDLFKDFLVVKENDSYQDESNSKGNSLVFNRFQGKSNLIKEDNNI